MRQKPVSSGRSRPFFQRLWKEKPPQTTTIKPFIILPLYIYPTATSWDILYSTLTTHPQLPFLIIINPLSGPGPAPYPNTNYIVAIAKLRTHTNTKILGYVHTTYAKRPERAVKNDISIYAGWKIHLESDIRVDGIFFDEAPNSYTREPFAYMSSVCQYAKEVLGGGPVVLNPGVRVDAAYYTVADFIVGYENHHSAYPTNSLDTVERSLRSVTSILVHHFTGTAKEQREIVLGLLREGFRGVFVSTHEYDEWSSLWSAFCGAVAAGA